jgi:hypothetical protein
VERRVERCFEQKGDRNVGDLKQPQARNCQTLRTAQTVDLIIQKVNQRHYSLIRKVTKKVIRTVKQQVAHCRVIKQGPS